MPPTPNCPHCSQPMQAADVVKHGDTVISVRWICGCKLPEIVHQSWHAGQAPGTR